VRIGRAVLAAALVTCARPERPVDVGEASSAARALEAFAAGEFDRAERLLAERPTSDRSPDLLHARARLFASRGETGEALEALEDALATPRLRAGEARDLHRTMARIALEAADFAGAIAHARAAGASEEDDPMLRAIAAFETPPYRVREGSSGAVPLRVGPLVETPVRLNDAVESILVLDSGASLTVLTRSLAERAGVEILAEGEDAIDPSGERISSAIGRLASIEIGRARIEEVPVLVVDDERLAFRLLGLFTVFRTEGAIGLGLLRAFRVALDLEGETLELSPAGDGVESAIPLRLVDGALFVPASAAGFGARAFFVDTGADRSSLSEVGARALGARVEIVTAPGRGASAGGTTVFLRRAERVDLEVGGESVGPLDLPIWGSGREGEIDRFGTIGLDVLRKYRIILEPKGLRLRLEPRSPGS